MSIWSWIKAGARLPIYVVRFHRIHGQSDGGAQSAGRLLIDPGLIQGGVGYGRWVAGPKGGLVLGQSPSIGLGRLLGIGH